MQTESIKTPQDLFYYNLNRLMEERGYTVTTLAEAMNVTKASISDYKNGKRFPSSPKLQEFADFFRISPAQLIMSPEELFRYTYKPEPQSSPKRMYDDYSAAQLQASLDSFTGKERHEPFQLNVCTSALSPVAVSGDVLECVVPSTPPDGQMVLLNMQGDLRIGRAYRSGTSFLFIPASKESAPVQLSLNDPRMHILAVVLSRKHTF